MDLMSRKEKPVFENKEVYTTRYFSLTSKINYWRRKLENLKLEIRDFLTKSFPTFERPVATREQIQKVLGED